MIVIVVQQFLLLLFPSHPLHHRVILLVSQPLIERHLMMVQRRQNLATPVVTLVVLFLLSHCDHFPLVVAVKDIIQRRVQRVRGVRSR